MSFLVAGGFVLVLLFPNWTRKKLQKLQMYFQSNHRAGENQINKDEYHPITNTKITKNNRLQWMYSVDHVKENGTTTYVKEQQQLKQENSNRDEIKFLRLIYLLYRMADPVVRMIFNRMTQHTQLRTILDEIKEKMNEKYRTKKNIIDDYQWSLLYEKQKVSSDDFDIGLMVNILDTLPDIDTSILPMLNKIRNIRNTTTRICEEKLLEDECNRYCDEIEQAVLRLLSSYPVDIECKQKKIQLISRLLDLNSIIIDNKKMCLFIELSERYPAEILQKLIIEYCNSKQISIESMLRKEKHQLYHRRFQEESCCECTNTRNNRCTVLSEQMWKAVYDLSVEDDNCRCKQYNCIKRFVPKRIITFDAPLAVTLILNIPQLLNYMIRQLLQDRFEQFLKQNQHTLYHCMERKQCCRCNNVPTEKIIFTTKEWNLLFCENGDTCSDTDFTCCCQYSVINSIEYSTLENVFLSKIFYSAGPFGFLKTIEQDAFAYFLNWTIDDQPLRSTLQLLLTMIKDQQFNDKYSPLILSQSHVAIPTKWDARLWVARHLRQQKATTEHKRDILVQYEDSLEVISVQIPIDFPRPHTRQKFNNLTTEENNYLVVVYGLTRIVYPIIKNEFKTQCPDNVLKKDQSPDLQKQLVSSEKLKNPDFQLMINILKNRSKSERNKGSINHLDVTERIRREIVQSSSGTLDQTKFNDIISRMSKAVLHFGGEKHEDKWSRLRNIRNIVE